MLVGKYTNNLDAKSRIFLPAKWRPEFSESETVYVLYGFGSTPDERYLQIMSTEKFNALVKTVNSLPPTDMSFIKAKRFILANARDQVMDKQGRVLIPQPHLQHASLENEVCLVGVSDHIEVWNPELYDKVNAGYDFAQFALDMQTLADRELRSSQDERR